MTWIEQQIDRLMRGQPAGFREVITEALVEEDTLPEAIEALEEIMLESPQDGRLTIEVLRRLPLSTTDVWVSPLHTVMAWMEDAEVPAAAVLRDDGVPELVRIYDALYEQLEDFDEDPLAVSGDMMAVLRILTLYRAPGTIDRLIEAGQHPILRDAYLWSAVFEVLGAPEHPWRLDVIEAFEAEWPSGCALAAFLSHANLVAFDGELARHPFDSPAGLAALREALLGGEDGIPGWSRAAAAALCFVDAEARPALLELAEDHFDVTVRIEAAAVRAASGDDSGITRLERWAADPRYAETAIAHLRNLDAEDAIPDISESADFRAASAMAGWLAQPGEFNRPPDELSAVDTRVLHWPPTDDRRRVWLFRYRYWPLGADDVSFEGLGMVGSVTYALADEDTEQLSVPEAYGLHCAWELEMMDDARAPPFRDPKAGLRILRGLNPGF